MTWPDAVDEILDGDQALALAYTTPARGTVVTPVTNNGLRDRAAGTIETVNSSIGMWRKLERIQREPRVALAYHTREHGRSARPEFVLVQGTAQLTPLDDRGEYVESIAEAWKRAAGRSHRLGPIRDRWLRVYHSRAGLTVDVKRIVVWPDLRCSGTPEVHGAPLPEAPQPQRPPGKGTGPRVRHRRAARRAASLPNVLLGWLGEDGFPVVAPVTPGAPVPGGIVLDAAPGLVPPGGRRAGLLAHAFTRHVIGQNKRQHTGWLESADTIVYAPHTESGYRLPPLVPLYDLAAGFVTRRGYRAGRRAGFLP